MVMEVMLLEEVVRVELKLPVEQVEEMVEMDQHFKVDMVVGSTFYFKTTWVHCEVRESSILQPNHRDAHSPMITLSCNGGNPGISGSGLLDAKNRFKGSVAGYLHGSTDQDTIVQNIPKRFQQAMPFSFLFGMNGKCMGLIEDPFITLRKTEE